MTDCLPDSARHVIISVNPGSGATDQSELVQALASELTAGGLEVETLDDLDAVDARVGTRLEAGDLRCVVAAGGDGTVSLLSNRLPSSVAFAILPLGTENLLAKYLELPSDPVYLAKVICGGQTVRLDAGRANDKLFLIMASCGFDADVVHRLHQTRKGHIHHWSYARPILNSLQQYRYPAIRIFVDDDPVPIIGKWAFVFNVPRYAMNLPIVDDADSQDGLLDLCTFERGRLLRGFVYFGAILLKQHRWKKTRVRRFKRLKVESDEPVRYQLDGDPGGQLPLEIEVCAGLLKVVVSEDWIRKNERGER